MKPKEFRDWLVSEFGAQKIDRTYWKIPLNGGEHAMLWFRQVFQGDVYWIANSHIYDRHGKTLRAYNHRLGGSLETLEGQQKIREIVAAYARAAQSNTEAS